MLTSGGKSFILIFDILGWLREEKIKTERQFQPAQFLAISFMIAIGIGTILLLLPFSTKSGHISFMDALFTSASAVCVTGLVVQDTAAFFTPAGKIIIMTLFQLGGLGIMTFSTLILLVAGKKISFKDRLIIQEGFHYSSLNNVRSLIKNVFIYSFSIEILGSFFFFLYWKDKLPADKALFHSIFHSVSAFCNAGFSTFSNSFEDYVLDLPVNIILMLLIVLGGVGFLVINEGREYLVSVFRGTRFKLSLHTKMVVFMTFFLIFISLAVFLLLEWNGSLQGISASGKIMAALFQIITPRTAGFNTMDLNVLAPATIFLFLFLMFVGASPGSTGGGIKTSTVGVLFAFLKSKVRAMDSAPIFKRTLPQNLILKAFTLFTLAVVVVLVSAFLLFVLHPEFGMKNILFEVFSAFGTVGLSLGITPKLGGFGKLVIILTMYIGRIGPLTMLYAFSRSRSFGKYEFVEETIMIG